MQKEEPAILIENILYYTKMYERCDVINSHLRKAIFNCDLTWNVKIFAIKNLHRFLSKFASSK